jgi:hypothetical protein
MTSFIRCTAVTGSLLVEPRPGVARAAVDSGLQVELSDTLERADEEGADRDETAGVWRLEMALAELA